VPGWPASATGSWWSRCLVTHRSSKPVEQKLFRAVRVTEDVATAFELLTLLSKDNLRDNRIQELWRGFFVDHQVKAALDELFNTGEPACDLVALVAKRVRRRWQPRPSGRPGSRAGGTGRGWCCGPADP